MAEVRALHIADQFTGSRGKETVKDSTIPTGPVHLSKPTELKRDLLKKTLARRRGLVYTQNDLSATGLGCITLGRREGDKGG